MDDELWWGGGEEGERVEEREEKEMSGCNGTWKKRAIRWLNGMSVKEEKMKGEGFEEKKNEERM